MPFIVDATDNGIVTNLNADMLDGQHASAFATSGHTHSWNSITAPTGNLSLSHGNYTTTFSFTGTTSNAFTMENNSITSGSILNLSSAATGFTGTLANVTLLGNNAANTGTLIKASVTGTSSAAIPLMITNLGTGLSFRVNDETGDADATPFVIDASGNVGIGTASPGTKLDVAGAIRTNNQFISTVATGTAPISVSSTTTCSNLNADLLDGYHAGNASGNIPVSNGTVNTNLNADMLDGYHASYFAPATGGAYANQQLSNLSGTVAVNLNLLPNADATRDLGSSSMRWNNLYVRYVHADQVDPTFKIDGRLYVTWMAENIGMWIDYIGQARLVNGEFKVDMDQQPRGSDLWLFWRSVAEGSIIPFVTAQDPAILMANVEGSVLTVKAISGDKNARFSVRLSGKRLDWATKTPEEVNIQPDDNHMYIDLDKYNRKGELK